MIIRDDKNIEINSLFPDSDWYEEGNSVVPDGTDLAAKVKKFAPYMDIIYGSDGSVVDVLPLEKPPESESPFSAKTSEERIAELEQLVADLTEIVLLGGGA